MCACVYACCMHVCVCKCIYVQVCAPVCVCMGLCVYMYVAAVGWGVYLPLEIKGQPWLSFLSHHLPSFATMSLIGQELTNK